MESVEAEALSPQKVADITSDDSMYQDALSSPYASVGGDAQCPSINVDQFEEAEEAFLPNGMEYDEENNIAMAPSRVPLKHSQSDKYLSGLTASFDRNRLMSDTKLVVLHYISGSCSSCSSSPSVSHLQSPSNSESDRQFQLWETDSLVNRDRLRKRKFCRPRFNSTPAFVYPNKRVEERTKEPVSGENSIGSVIGVTSSIAEDDEEMATDDDGIKITCESASPVFPPSSSAAKACRPKLKVDVIEEQSEFDFLTPEEKLLMDIDAEVSKTLSGLNLDDEDLLPRTPHTKVADFLQVIGKQYDRVFNDAIRQNVPPTPPHIPEPKPGIEYNDFVELVDDVTDNLSPLGGWHQIALYMRFGSALVSHLMSQGRAGVTFVADYTARIIFDRAAEFLIEHGGWGAVANMSPTNPLFTSSSSSSTNQSRSPLPMRDVDDNIAFGFMHRGTFI
ncbi:uncharacterized protein [Watersipora subatra]|uniref:uncharacterized protein isoform X2 n=1 Tax=Watersipora subatra TaxID=2589382 RepID=UPI00355C5A04